MSLSDTLKAGALLALHAAVEALHSDLAAKLNATGVPASPDDHADDLVAKAQAAGTASPTTAPNSADHALAQYQSGFAAALAAFATAHLPAKFLPGATSALATLDNLLDGDPTNNAEAVHDAIQAGVAVTAALNPLAGVAVSIAAPIIENIADEVITKHEAGETVSTPATAPVQVSVPPAAPAAPVATWEQ